MKEQKMLLVGVGGQGTILASKIIAWIGLELGMSVKMSEIHGMAQRGGSVTTQICFGEQIYSPVIEPGEADILISFELLEAKRSLHMLKKDGLLIVNDQRINPMPVLIGAAVYPENILDDLKSHTENIHLVPALDVAHNLGNTRVANIVLLGSLSALWSDIPKDIWSKALEANIPARFKEVNFQAFNLGQNLAK